MLLRLKQLEEAEALLAEVKPDKTLDDRVATLRQGVTFARSGESGPGEAELAKAIAANPEDLESRFRRANLLAGKGSYREALEELLEIGQRKKDFKDGEARKQMVAIFSLASSQPDLVSEYRRKLSSALY